MREMIRTIEDTQTEQALHGLLSLNPDSSSGSASPSVSTSVMSPPTLPASVASGVTSSTLGMPGGSCTPVTSLALTDPPPIQSSMAALSMLLKQRSSMGQLIGQPMVAAEPHHVALQLSSPVAHTNGRAADFRPAEESDGEEEKPLMLKVEHIPQRETAAPHRETTLPSYPHQPPLSPDQGLPPPSSSSPLSASPPAPSAMVTPVPRVAVHSTDQGQDRRESVVGSMLRAPPRFQYTLSRPQPQLVVKTEGTQSSPALVKNEAGSPTETVVSMSALPSTLAAASPVGRYNHFPRVTHLTLPLPLHAQPSVIVQNATLDLRKKSDEQISRSPIKKRPYIPSSMVEEKEADSGSDSSPKALPEVDRCKQRKVSHSDHQEPSQSSDVFSTVRSPDSYSSHNDRMKEALQQVPSQSQPSVSLATAMMRSKAPLPSSSFSPSSMTISKKHEEDAKLTVPYMISRLHESYNAIFTFLKVRLSEMKQKLQDYNHQNTMERMIGRIISQSLSSPNNVVGGEDVGKS